MTVGKSINSHIELVSTKQLTHRYFRCDVDDF